MNIQKLLYALCVQAMINLPLLNTREIMSNTKGGRKDPGNLYIYIYITLLDHFIL